MIQMKRVTRSIIWVCVAVALFVILIIPILLSKYEGVDAPYLDSSQIDAVLFEFPNTDGSLDGNRRMLRDKTEIDRFVAQINETSGKQCISTASLGYDENRLDRHVITLYSGSHKYAVVMYGYRIRNPVVYIAIEDDMYREYDKDPKNSLYYYHTFSYLDELNRLFELSEPWP